MALDETNQQEALIALQAFGWTLEEEKRASRLLALTGLTPAEMRARLAEPAFLAEIIRFLESHEPDLIACAEALDTTPETLVMARERLER